MSEYGDQFLTDEAAVCLSCGFNSPVPGRGGRCDECADKQNAPPSGCISCEHGEPLIKTGGQCESCYLATAETTEELRKMRAWLNCEKPLPPDAPLPF